MKTKSHLLIPSTSKQLWPAPLAAFLAIILALSLGQPLFAAPGDLDPSFGSGGTVTTSIGAGLDQAYAMAIDANGKIVMAGASHNGTDNDIAVARYNSDGTLDTSFDTDGKVTTPVGAGDDTAYAIAIDGSGKIVVAGDTFNGTNLDVAVVRYNSDGTLDTSFDINGIVKTDAGAVDGLRDITIDSSGKIVGVGNSGLQYLTIRYNSNGSLDTSFDSDGIVTTLPSLGGIGGSHNNGHAVAIDSSGKILAAGRTGSSPFSLSVLRYNSNGSLDTSFDSDGIATTTIGNYHSIAYDMTIDGSGKILLAGIHNNDFVLARYNSDGSLDTSFDSDGLVTTNISNDDTGQAMTIDGSGKIIVAGESNGDFSLARYNSDGSLDSGFGSGGTVTTPIGAGQDGGRGVAIDSSGKIVVAGFSDNDFAIARYGAVDGPTLEVADATLDANGGSISVPALFISNGASIASVGFSVDYQESCLSFDATDANSDNVPDSISGLPAGFEPNITHDGGDTDGELDISLVDDSTPIGTLNDGTLLTIAFDVLAACVTTDGSTTDVTVGFSSDPAASFGDPTAADVPGTSSGGTLTLEFNATPTDITLTPSSVDENAASGTTVGTLTTTDPNAGDTHTYTLVAGTGDDDNGSFAIVGDQLQTAVSFNFEVKSSYTVRVQTDDGGPNGTFEKALTITINDVNDAPVAVDDLVDPLTTVVVGTASVNIDVLDNDSDEDVGDTLTVDALTQPAAGSATDNDSDVTFTGPDANGTATFTYQATDGLLNSADATVTVQHVKDDLRGDCNSSGSVSAADFVGVVLELFDAGNDPQYQSNPAWWSIYAGGYAGSPIGCDANASKNGPSNDSDSVTAADIICTVRVFFGDTSCTSGSLVAAAAQRSSAALMEVADVAANAGAAVEVPITLQSAGNVAAAAFTISYDATNLSFDGSDANGDGMPDALDLNLPAGVQTWVQMQEGQIQVVLAGLQLPLSALADGTLATATFDVVSNGGTVRLTNVTLGDTGGADLAVTTTEGTVGTMMRSYFLPLVTR